MGGAAGRPPMSQEGTNRNAILEVRDATLRFGGVTALDAVSFDVREGDIVGLIGPNGAGKTTLFNCLSGLYELDHGDIRFEGRSLLGQPPARIARGGIARTFQNLALFGTLSVLDNVLVGGHGTGHSGFLRNAIGGRAVRGEEATLRDRAREVINELALDAVEGSQEVEFEFRPEVKGRHTYTVAVPPLGSQHRRVGLPVEDQLVADVFDRPIEVHPRAH